MLLTAGELRHRVTVQARTETSDGHDGLVDSWAALKSRIPAQVLPLLGRDLERAQQIDPRVSHTVSVRYWRSYQTDLDGGRTRLVYHPTSDSAADRLLEIVGAPVDVEERHIVLQMLAKEAA
jgi:head-tail adaptor